MSLPGYDDWLQVGDPGQDNDECPECGEPILAEQLHWYWRREGNTLHGIHECPSCGCLLHVYDHIGPTEPEEQPCGCPVDSYHLADCPINPYSHHYDRDDVVYEAMTQADYYNLLARMEARGYDLDDPAHPLFGH